jgi:hypothetical protein
VTGSCIYRPLRNSLGNSGFPGLQDTRPVHKSTWSSDPFSSRHTHLSPCPAPCLALFSSVVSHCNPSYLRVRDAEDPDWRPAHSNRAGRGAHLSSRLSWEAAVGEPGSYILGALRLRYPSPPHILPETAQHQTFASCLSPLKCPLPALPDCLARFLM